MRIYSAHSNRAKFWQYTGLEAHIPLHFHAILTNTHPQTHNTNKHTNSHLHFHTHTKHKSKHSVKLKKDVVASIRWWSLDVRDRRQPSLLRRYHRSWRQYLGSVRRFPRGLTFVDFYFSFRSDFIWYLVDLICVIIYLFFIKLFD